MRSVLWILVRLAAVAVVILVASRVFAPREGEAAPFPAAAAPRAAAGLRVALLNTQLYSPAMKRDLAAKLSLFEDGARERAATVADRLLARADLDAVVLCEVWDEDAKAELVHRLRGRFPHYVAKLDAQHLRRRLRLRLVARPLEDSGLMIFSRLPFAPLPDPARRWPLAQGSTREVAFVPFEASEGVDGLATKGAAFVRLRGGNGAIYGLVATHLQAGARFRRVRRSQLEELVRLVERTAGEEAVVLLGDLNVDGRRRGPGSEWRDVFGPGGVLAAAGFEDAFVSSGSPRESGVTAEGGQRLDYVALRSARGTGSPLVAQHVALALRGLSDHAGLVADLNVEGPACRPSTATPLGEGRHESALSRAAAMRWWRLDRPGTYTLELMGQEAAGLSWTVFRGDDLSVPAAGPRTRGVVNLDDPPYYLAIRARDRAWAGRFVLSLRRHRGLSAQDAIRIAPGAAPSGPAAPGATSWFVLDVQRAYSGRPQEVRIVLEDRAAAELRARVLDGRGRPVRATPWTSVPRTVLALSEPGPARLWLAVDRRDPRAEFAVSWTTNLTRLHGAEVPGAWSLELLCDDETGWDALGSDEIVVHVEVDGISRSLRLPDFDVGEYRYLDALGGFAYVDRVRVWLEEREPSGAQRGPVVEIRTLPRGQRRALREERVLTVADGRYRLRFNRSR